MTSRPAGSEYAPSFAGYVALVTESDVVPVLERQASEMARLLPVVTPDLEKYRYAEGKWTIREVFGHLIDGERVFSYRALCISRGETVSLPGFDENVYVAQSPYLERPLADLVVEFSSLRRANIAFFRGLKQSDWERRGTANDNPVSVRALAFIMAGHVRHHFNVLRDRYGVALGA
jgi:hypothetical protein